MRVLLDSQRALNVSVGVDLKGIRVVESMHYVRWDGSTSGGEVSIEGASSPDYAGTWTVLQAVAFTAAGKEDAVRVVGSYGAIRHRISADVTGGTVTTGYTIAV